MVPGIQNQGCRLVQQALHLLGHLTRLFWSFQSKVFGLISKFIITQRIKSVFTSKAFEVSVKISHFAGCISFCRQCATISCDSCRLDGCPTVSGVNSKKIDFIPTSGFPSDKASLVEAVQTVGESCSPLGILTATTTCWYQPRTPGTALPGNPPQSLLLLRTLWVQLILLGAH